MKTPMRVAVTGAAGQIGYALLFRIANGDLLGKDQPVILNLLDLPVAQKALDGVIMELNDCAFPLLAGVEPTDNPNVAFKDVDIAILVGSRPRGPGMERRDLLAANAEIFKVQGKALNDFAKRVGESAGRRQPGQHQRLYRHEVRAGPAEGRLHRDAAARP